MLRWAHSARGSVTVNSLPRPTPALVAVIVPRWASMAARATVSPIPSPASLAALARGSPSTSAGVAGV